MSKLEESLNNVSKETLPKNNIQEKQSSTLEQSLDKLTNKESRFEQTLGRYGVGESKYDIGITPFNVENLQEIRGQKQSGWEQLGLGITKGIAGLPLGIVQGASVLFDPDFYSKVTTGNFNEYSNSLADKISQVKESLNKELPIYRTEESKGFSPGTAGWWADILPSTIEAASLMIPAYGEVKALSLLGKAVGGTKLLKSVGALTGLEAKAIGEGLSLTSTATLSRMNEQFLQATDAAKNWKVDNKDRINPTTQQPYTKEELNQMSGEVANSTFYSGIPLVALDLLELNTIFKGFKGFKEARVANLDKSIGNTIKKVAIGEVLPESLDEAIQFIQQKEAEYTQDIKTKKVTPSTFDERLGNYLKDENLWTSAFAGGFGGVSMYVGGRILARNEEKIKDRTQSQAEDVARINDAVIKGDKQSFNKESDSSFANAVVQHIQDGTIDGFRDSIEKLSKSENEFLTGDDFNDKDFYKRLNSRINTLDLIDKSFYEIQNDDETPIELKPIKLATILDQRLTQNRINHNEQDLQELYHEDIKSGFPIELLEVKKQQGNYLAVLNSNTSTKEQKEISGKKLDDLYNSVIISQPRFENKSIKESKDIISKELITANDNQINKLHQSILEDKSDVEKAQKTLVGIKENPKELLEKLKTQKEKLKKEEVEKEKPIENKEPKTDIQNFAEKISKGEKLTSPEDLQFYDNNKDKIEEELLNIPKSISKLITEEPITSTSEEINEEQETPKTLFEDPKKRSIFTGESGLDEDENSDRTKGKIFKKQPLASERYYRYNYENPLNEGDKYQIVTKSNNKEIYNQIESERLSDENDTFKEEHKKIDGIYLVLVDKDNNYIKANQKGVIDTKGNLVYFTISTENRITNDEILVSDKKKAIEELNEFRNKALNKKLPKNSFVNIEGVSAGLIQFEPKIKGVRQFHSIKDRIDKPTLSVVTSKGKGLIGSTNQIGKSGTLYAINDKQQAIDLIPRRINRMEANKIISLIKEKNKSEIEKITMLGGKNKPYEFRIEGDNIVFGGKSLPINEINEEELANWLISNKKVQVNLKYDFNSEFTDVLSNKHESYKDYLLTSENPLFGTDIVTLDNIQVKQKYVIFEPEIKSDNITKDKEVKEPKTEVINGEFVTEIIPTIVKTEQEKVKEVKEIKDTPFGKVNSDEELKKILSGMSETTGEFDFGDDTLDRVKESLNEPLLTQEERNWFKERFPNTPIENIKGLIDNKSLGRVLNSGKVLLSDKATKGTLYHEAFHIVTQLYLTKSEIDKLYSEAKISQIVKNKEKELDRKLTRKEIEEVLAEDFFEYKETGKILQQRLVRNTLFRKILNFLKDLLNISASNIEDIYRRLDKGFHKNKPFVSNKEFLQLDRTLPEKDETFTEEVLDSIDAMFFDIIFKGNKTPDEAFNFTNSILNGKNGIKAKFEDSFLKIGRVLLTIPQEQRKNSKVQEIFSNFQYILNNWNLITERWGERANSFNIQVNLQKDLDENTFEINEEGEYELKNNDKLNFDDANSKSTLSSMSPSSKMLIKSLKQRNSDGTYKTGNILGLPILVNFESTYNFLLKETAGLLTNDEIYNKIKQLSEIKPEFKDLLTRLGKISNTSTLSQVNFINKFRQDFSKNLNTSFKTMFKADGEVYEINVNEQSSKERIKTQWINNVKDIDFDSLKNKSQTDLLKEGYDFLSSIGIKLSEETITELNKDKKKINNIINHIVDDFVKNREQGIRSIENIFNENSNLLGNMSYLYQMEGEFNPNISELSYKSTTGKTVYSISLNNFLSIIKNIINNSNTLEELYSRLPHLNTVTVEGSIWMKNLFDEKGNKIKDRKLLIDLADGMATDGSDKDISTQTSELNEADKLVQEINAVLISGRSSYIRASDASQEHTVALTGYNNKSKLPIPIEKLKDSFNIQEVKDIFHPYFKSELRRIYLFKKENLGKDIAQYNKTGDKFTIFEKLISSDIKKSIYRDIESGKSFDEIYNTYVSQTDETVVKFFNNYQTEITNKLKDFNIQIGQGISKSFDKYSIEQITRTIAVNDYINSVEQTKVLIGDMSHFKDLFKRSKGFVGSGEGMSTDSNTLNWINNKTLKGDGRTDGRIIDNTETGRVYQDVEQKLDEAKFKLYGNHSKFNEMNEADASMMITLDMRYTIENMMGTWNNKKQNIFNKINNKEKLTQEEKEEFGILKLQYSGPFKNSEIYNPGFLKIAAFTMWEDLVEGTNLQPILKSLKDTKQGWFTYMSGAKVGAKIDKKTGKANKLYTNVNSGEVNTENIIPTTLFYDFLKVQTKNNPSKDKNIFGTQFMQLLFSNLLINGESITEFPNSKELFQKYSKLIISGIERDKQKLIKDLGLSENGNLEDVDKLLTLLDGESKTRNLPDNIRDVFRENLEESKNIGKKLKYKIDTHPTKDKINSMLMGILNSRLIRRKINGDALIQTASTGWEDLGARKEGENELLQSYRKDENGKTLPAETIISMNKSYQPLLDRFGSLEAVNKAIEEGKIADEILEFIVYRIPTEKLSSIDFFKIKKFLPSTTGNTIIPPTIVVAKSGTDYDNDKMNAYRPYLTKDGMDIIKGNTKEGEENEILNIAKEVLSHPHSFNSLVTPNNQDIINETYEESEWIDKLNKDPNTKLTKEEYFKEKERAKSIPYSEQLKLTYRIKQFTNFMTSGKMIGPLAIQLPNHILTQTANITLNKYNELTNKTININFPHLQNEKGNIKFSNIKDVNGDNISEVLGQIGAGIIDDPKDPKLSSLNLTLETLPILTYLIRTGVDGRIAMWFLKQPIISEYLQANFINNSIHLKATGKSEFKDQILYKVRKKYTDSLGIKYNDIDSYSNFLNQVFTTENDLKQYLFTKNQTGEEFNKVQLQVLKDFLKYQEQTREIGDFIRSVNHINTGFGKDLSVSRRKLELMDKVRKGGWINGMDDLINNSMVKGFNQHQFAINSLSPIYHTQTNEIQGLFQSILNSLDNIKSEELINKTYSLIENDFIQYVIQNYGFTDTKQAKNRLFNTTEVVDKIKNIKSNSKHPLHNNLFIKELYPLLSGTQKNMKGNHIKLFSKRFDTFKSNQLTSAFKEIELEEIDLFDDLCNIGILQSGTGYSPITYTNLIPYEFYNDLVKGAFEIFEAKKGENELEKFKYLFLQNNPKGKQKQGWIYGKNYDKSTVPKKKEIKNTVKTNTVVQEYLLDEGFKYYGAYYEIEVFNGIANNVLNLKKGVSETNIKFKEREQKILDAYNENPNVDKQNGKKFRSNEKESKKELDKYELYKGVFANEQQKEAIDKLDAFINNKENKSFILIGKGGTGKTTIIKKIVEQESKKGKSVLGVTVAHQAKKILGKSIGKDKVKTLASALAIKLNTETGKFIPDQFAREKGKVPIKFADLIIVDETSMVSKELLNEIKKWMKPTAKVIFMGDKGQLPPIGEDVIESPTFNTNKTENEKSELTQRMRQAEDSPILPLSDNVYLSKETRAIKNRVSKLDQNNKGVLFIKSEKVLLDEAVKDFQKDPNNTKIITYNNENNNNSQSVKNINLKVRDLLWKENKVNQFNIGELLTAYDTYGEENEPIISNSDNITVLNLKTIQFKDSVSVYSNAKGSRSFSFDYKVTILQVKDQENKVIDNIPVIANESKNKFNEDVQSLFKTDMQLGYALKQKFANLQYGYAITSHKAQGSEYKNVYVLEDNIITGSPATNLTKNQSLYVAITRAKEKLVMQSSLNSSDDITPTYTSKTDNIVKEELSNEKYASTFPEEEETAYNRLDNVDNEPQFQKEEVNTSKEDIIESTEELKTFNLGTWEGKKQTKKAQEEINQRIIISPDLPMGENFTGESFNDASKRVINKVKEILEIAEPNSVILTHNTVFGLIKLWDKYNRPKLPLNSDFRKEYTTQDSETGDFYKIKGNKGELWVVRHGETEDNLTGNFRKDDVELTEKGVEQAKEVGKELKDVVIPKIYSSSLPRAIHTSNLILDENDIINKTDIVSNKVAQQVIKDFLSRTKVPTKIITQQEAKEILGDKYIEGIQGFYHNNITYIISEDGNINLDSLIHENSHPFIDVLLIRNPELFKNIMKQVREENPDIVKYVEDNYREDFIKGVKGNLIPTNKALKEMAVRAITKLGVENIDVNTGEVKTGLEKLWEAFKNIIKDLLGINTINLEDLSPNTTLKELADLITTFKGEINLADELGLNIEEQFKKEESPIINSIREAKDNLGTKLFNILDGNFYINSRSKSGEAGRFLSELKKEYPNLIVKNYRKTDEPNKTFISIDESKVDEFAFSNVQFKKGEIKSKESLIEPESEELKKEKEFKEQNTKQYVFFKRRIYRLENELKKYKEGTKEYNEKLAEINNYKTKLESAVTSGNREDIKNLGKEVFNKLENFIKGLENGSIKIKGKDIEYAEDVIDTFKDFLGLADDAISLRQKITPFVNSFVLERVNEYKTEEKEITKNEIEKTTIDINRLRKGLGALQDVYEYLGRTIGSIIKAAQNRVTTKNKELADKIEKEIDSLKEYSKKQGISEKDIYKPFIQEFQGTTILTREYTSEFYNDKSQAFKDFKSVDNKEKGRKWLSDNSVYNIEEEQYEDKPQSKYINSNYTKIINTPELKKFYDFHKEITLEAKKKLPITNITESFIANIKKNTFEMILNDEKGVLSGAKDALKNIIEVKESSESDFISDEDLIEDKIYGRKYIKKLPISEKSNDLGNNLFKFASFANSYDEMSDVLPEVRLLQRKIANKKYIKSSDPTKRIEGEDSNIFKMVDDYINTQVKGEKLEEGKINLESTYDEDGNEVKRYFHLSDVVDLGLKFNSILRIGINPFNAVTNVLIGDIGNIIEGFGAKYYTLSNLKDATNIFFKQNFKDGSELNKWLEKLNPLQELEDYSTEEKISLKSNKITPEGVRNLMFSPQKAGEKFLQTRTMIAIMIKEGIMTSKGEITTKGKNLSEKETRELTDLVQRVNQLIHGRYSSRDSATLQQNVLFRMVSQFRKWISSAVESRIGNKQYDLRLKSEIEGRYITAYNLLFKNLKDSVKRLQKGELSELEIYNMKKNLIDGVIILGSILLYAGLKGDDEDKEWRKNPYVKFGLTQLDRVSGDLLFFYSPEQITHLTENVIPLSKTAMNLIHTSGNINYIFGDYDKKGTYKKGRKKGENKFWSGVGDLTPGYKPTKDVIRLWNPVVYEDTK